MNKINTNILALCFLFSSSLFGQSITEQIKNSYFDQFPKGKTHFFLKVNAVLFTDDSPRNLTNPADWKDDHNELLNNISIGYTINDALVIGVSSMNSHVDYRNDGEEPIIDSITTYGRNLFVEYNFLKSFELTNNVPILKNVYVSLQRPFKRIDNHNLSEMEVARLGLGIRYKVFKHLKADMHYHQLIDQEINEGFRKGKLTFGVIVVI